MHKTIMLSLACTMAVMGAEATMGEITVETQGISQRIDDVSGEELKSADLAEALAKQSASVKLVRRSGISNDIIIRGLKKDNINVTIDGAKAYGAGPNRMDPPISHVLTNTIDHIALTEGPYNVEDFGVLGADVKIDTKEPKQGFAGEISGNIGSFGYGKGAITLTGGTETLRFLVTASKEEGDQYEDGKGRTFAEQQDDFIATHPTVKGLAYLPAYRTMDAFHKNSLLTKLAWHVSDNQRLELSYTRNRSDNILYPNTPMDAIAVDDDIYNLRYTIEGLGRYSKRLSMQAYYSDIYHPMSNQYRKKSKLMTMAHKLTDRTKGVKIKNEFEIAGHAITIGVDGSSRRWDGGFYKNDKPFPKAKFHSIWDAKTDNVALFIKDSMRTGAWQIDSGLRLDHTTVSTARPGVADRTYRAVNANLFATYRPDKHSRYFVGIGRSSRVPDGKELYFHNPKGKAIGDPHLNQVINTEADVGAQWQTDQSMLKVKFFYSDLSDYILYNATKHRYVNADAAIYGGELIGSYALSDALYVDASLAYQRGRKKKPLAGQSDKDLPEIPPLKLTIGATYDYDDTLSLRADFIASAKWSRFDGDNGEQALDGYRILNVKVEKTFFDALTLTVGVDNLFDTTYALSNTYKDQTLIAGGGVDDVMLLNEPGRYVYANLRYRF